VFYICRWQNFRYDELFLSNKNSFWKQSFFYKHKEFVSVRHFCKIIKSPCTKGTRAITDGSTLLTSTIVKISLKMVGDRFCRNCWRRTEDDDWQKLDFISFAYRRSAELITYADIGRFTGGIIPGGFTLRACSQCLNVLRIHAGVHRISYRRLFHK